MRRRALQLAWWAGLYVPPDRELLQNIILPFYANATQWRRLIFVGTRFYTRSYVRMFSAGVLSTIDMDPRMAKYGASSHFVDTLQNLGSHVSAGSIDAIIANGVIGWGIDDQVALRDALSACAMALRVDGHLILGTNDLLKSSPALDASPALAPSSPSKLFEPMVFEPLGAPRYTVQTPFAEREHTFSFWRRIRIPPAPAGTTARSAQPAR